MILVVVELTPATAAPAAAGVTGAAATAGATEVSLESVAFARVLAAATEGPVHAVVVGGDLPEGLAAQLGGHGVAALHHVTGDPFTAYGGGTWATAVAAAVAESGADVVLAPGTPRGMEVVAHLAARFDVAMAANVVAVTGSTPLVVTRQVMGGAVLEEMRLPDRPALLTVAGHAVEALPVAQPAPPAAVRALSPEVADVDLVARVVATEPAEPDRSGALTSARVVVGAGRGAGGPDGFDGVVELARLLDGALGVSRVVTSLGWRPHHEQVGQTGSRISPEIYIPCGISGAIQHWAGCSSSRTILAINVDDQAPMVTKATYAVIGDMAEVVPAINAELRRRG